jgi:hypothetical protein
MEEGYQQTWTERTPVIEEINGVPAKLFFFTNKVLYWKTI